MYLHAYSVDGFTHYEFKRDFYVKLRYTGEVAWSFGAIIATSCSFDLDLYPVDTQNCSIIFENWIYTIDEVELIQEGHLYNCSKRL